MKSHTDIEQSKKLAEILPLESADMCYLSEESLIPRVIYNGMVFFNSKEKRPTNIIYCWSLAALLSVIPKTINFGYENDSTFVLKPLTNDKYLADYYEISYVKDNPVDACYEMILKLHELNLL